LSYGPKRVLYQSNDRFLSSRILRFFFQLFNTIKKISFWTIRSWNWRKMMYSLNYLIIMKFFITLNFPFYHISIY